MRAFDLSMSVWMSDERRAAACTRCTYHALSPRGEMPNPSTSPSSADSWRGSPPAAPISHTCIEPLRSERKRIFCPSALQRGARLFDEVSVSRTGTFDARSWIQTVVTPRFSCML